jgi:uncharacterized membrane protein
MVHFPIALLMVAPVFVLLGAVLRDARGRNMLFSALLIMFLGTAGTFAARLSGDAAAKTANTNGPAHQVLENHEELAETTSIAFSILTLTFGGIVGFISYRKQPISPPLRRFAPLAFLVLYGGGIALLINAAHQGGRLTHEFGVNLKAAPPQQPVTATTSAGSQENSD